MAKGLRILAVTTLLVMAVGACTKSGDSEPTDPSAQPSVPSGSDTPSPVSGPLKIKSFTAPKKDECTGNLAQISASWETSGASTIEFSVDGEPMSADAGQPVTGEGDLLVPCDGKSHTITLTATSPKDKSVSKDVTVATEVKPFEG